jgi:hypothetical protein
MGLVIKQLKIAWYTYWLQKAERGIESLHDRVDNYREKLREIEDEPA